MTYFRNYYIHEKEFLTANKRDLAVFYVVLLTLCFPIFYSIITCFTISDALNIIPIFAITTLITLVIIFTMDFTIKRFDKVKIKTNFHPTFIVLILFMIYITISSFVNPQFYAKASLDRNILGIGFEALVHFISYFIIFLAAFSLKDNNLKIKLLKVFCLISIYVGILAFIDPNGTIVPAHLPGIYTYKWSSMFLNPNHFGYYLVLTTITSTMIFLNSKNLYEKFVYGFCFVLNVSLLLINQSYGPKLAVFITLLFLPFYYFFKTRKWSLSFSPLIAFLVVALFVTNQKFYLDTHNTLNEIFKLIFGTTSGAGSELPKPIPVEVTNTYGTNRIGLWREAIEYIKSSPIFGIGIGNFDTKIEGISLPHNEYINYALTFGIPALVLYLGIIITAFVQRIITRRYTTKESNNILTITFPIVFAYLISALFGNTMPHVMPYFVIITGILLSSISPIKQNKLK